MGQEVKVQYTGNNKFIRFGLWEYEFLIIKGGKSQKVTVQQANLDRAKKLAEATYADE